jgi:carboxypeptidase PM20D1
MGKKTSIGLVAGAGLGAAAAAALRRRWTGRAPGTGGESPAPGPSGEAFLEHLAEGVRIPTISHEDPDRVDSASFAEFHEFLRATYPRTFDRLRTAVVAGHSLLLEWEGRDPLAPPILLLSHLDVVPVEAGTEDDWPQPPFAGVRDEEHLWGRGTIDDKGPLVGMFEAVEGLLAEGFEPEVTLFLAIGHDEEVGGARGAAAIAEVLAGRGIRFEFVLDEGGAVVESFFPEAEGSFALIGIGEKGYLDVELVATAEGGHSSVPPAHTAVGRLAAAVYRLENHPMPARVGVQAAFFTALAPALPGVQGVALRNAVRLGPLVERRLAALPHGNALIRTTAAVTMIDGGVKPNVLPQRARAVVNFRILPGDTIEGVLEYVQRVVGDDIEVNELESGFSGSPPPLATTDSAAYGLLTETVAEVFPGCLPAPWILMGATDSRHYVTLADDVYRFAPFRMTPDDMGRVHGTGERIRLADAEGVIAFYRRLIGRACGAR